MQYAKAHPGEISYATIGAGSAQEIFARQLEKLTGITMNRVPFRTGPQVMPELIAGRVQFYVSPTLAVLPQYQQQGAQDDGGLRAGAAQERARRFPTLKEKGVDFVRFGWLGICAAAGTPQPIVDQLNRHIAAIVATPDYRS